MKNKKICLKDYRDFMAMTKKEAKKILSQVAKPLSKDKKFWITDQKVLEAIKVLYNWQSEF